MRRVVLGLIVMVTAAATAAVSPSAARTQAASGCDPIQTPPEFRGEVPPAQEVLGFSLGSQEVTSAESDRYVKAVDAASDRVVSAELGISAQGRPLVFAIVGDD